MMRASIRVAILFLVFISFAQAQKMDSLRAVLFTGSHRIDFDTLQKLEMSDILEILPKLELPDSNDYKWTRYHVSDYIDSTAFQDTTTIRDEFHFFDYNGDGANDVAYLSYGKGAGGKLTLFWAYVSGFYRFDAVAQGELIGCEEVFKNGEDMLQCIKASPDTAKQTEIWNNAPKFLNFFLDQSSTVGFELSLACLSQMNPGDKWTTSYYTIMDNTMLPSPPEFFIQTISRLVGDSIAVRTAPFVDNDPDSVLSEFGEKTKIGNVYAVYR